MTTAPPPHAARIAWMVSPDPVEYPQAVAFMEARARAISSGDARELVWLLEHPPLYTAGTSAQPSDLLTPDRFPVYASGRGGEYTYHGPGQRVGYVMLNVKARGGDVRAFVHQLETWLIKTLAAFSVEGAVRPGRVGVWVERSCGEPGAREEKIAALGLRVSRGVSFHGVALNVAPDLSHFSGIVPCGLTGYGVTSLAALGVTPARSEVDCALRQAFEAQFGPTVPTSPRDEGVPQR